MTSISEALQQGYELHRAGRIDEAEGIYRQVLAVDPSGNLIELFQAAAAG